MADFDDHVAILSMTARLLFVTAALGNRFADRLPITDRGRMMVDLDAIAALQLGQAGPQMLVIDAPQPHSWLASSCSRVRARILLQNAGQGAGQLDVVLAVRGLDRQRAVARRQAGFDRRRQLACAKPVARFDPVYLGNGDEVAIAGFGDLVGFVALHGKQGTNPAMFVAGAFEVAIFMDRSANCAGQGQPTNRSAMINFEGMNGRGIYAQARRGCFRTRSFMA